MNHRFFFTMNMQSRSGNPTHQVVGSCRDAGTIEEVKALVETSNFIVIEEFYKDDKGGYYSKGNTILNTIHIGKIKYAGE